MRWRHGSLRHRHGDDVEVVPGTTGDAVVKGDAGRRVVEATGMGALE